MEYILCIFHYISRNTYMDNYSYYRYILVFH